MERALFMKKKKRKLRVFEAFAGIGAQASALERMNIDYEIVGISDWFIDAIECYAAIHCDDVQVDMPKDISEIDKYLSKFTFSATSVKPTNIKRLTEDQRRDLYRANKKAKNYGSITVDRFWMRYDHETGIMTIPAPGLYSAEMKKN